jgi:hypothetical protein
MTTDQLNELIVRGLEVAGVAVIVLRALLRLSSSYGISGHLVTFRGPVTSTGIRSVARTS